MVDWRVDEAGRFGREVAHRRRGVVSRRVVEAAAPGQAEVDELRRQTLAVPGDEDVGRLHVTVDDPQLVHVLQRGEDAGGEPERGGDVDRATGQHLVEGLAAHAWLHHVEVAVSLAAPDDASGRAEVDAFEQPRLVLQAQVDGRRHTARFDRLDDHLLALEPVDTPVGVDAVARLEQREQFEAPVDELTFGRIGRFGGAAGDSSEVITCSRAQARVGRRGRTRALLPSTDAHRSPQRSAAPLQADSRSPVSPTYPPTLPVPYGLGSLPTPFESSPQLKPGVHPLRPRLRRPREPTIVGGCRESGGGGFPGKTGVSALAGAWGSAQAGRAMSMYSELLSGLCADMDPVATPDVARRIGRDSAAVPPPAPRARARPRAGTRPRHGRRPGARTRP